MKNIFSDTIEVDNLEMAEKVIQGNLESFLMMFDSSPACMSITTEDRIYVKINKRFLEIYGFDESEIIGRNAREVGILEQAEHERVSTIIREKGRIKNEIIKCKSKDRRDIYAISCIEQMELNGKNYLVSSFLDITPLKEQQHIIEQQHREILESIRYAQLIQKAIFPSKEQLDAILPESFVLLKPKHIVSGDFYWIEKHEDKIFIAACDCTGHGVPGAFISIIGYKLLSKCVTDYEHTNPAEILNQLNNEFQHANEKMNHKDCEIKDGMDIALCVIDTSKMIMEYAGAYNPIYQVKNGTLTKLATDKIPIHLFSNNTDQKFTNYQINIESGDCYYLFSDGYADQFGGENGKKFTYKNFQDLILSIQNLSMPNQREVFDQTIEEWKVTAGEEEQTDDILILGFKVP
ncbi:PP2C family protein-serine/threonine phosphatase [Fluviicola chungangensis]|uniref:SpoIIE family protein phosphatase n=1 Tax=Fluviicola chungangensis TaxID=2597671 RepID=A0A556MQQ8_9FLAO|nr:SpoIIE family protein phosphatase [Fluviicola chungangensis]TSJ42089.1 SpoIIE family protein phosphatase [Fluviicola chungangensis]